MKHSDAVNTIRLAITKLGGISVPYTVGKFRALDNPDRIISVGIEGVSDVIAMIQGVSIFVEVKVDRDKQRDEQRKFMNAVRTAGGIYVLAHFTATSNGVHTLCRALTGDRRCRFEKKQLATFYELAGIS